MSRSGTLWKFDSIVIVRNLRSALDQMSMMEAEGISTPYGKVATALNVFLDVVISDVPVDQMRRFEVDAMVRSDQSSEDE